MVPLRCLYPILSSQRFKVAYQYLPRSNIWGKQSRPALRPSCEGEPSNEPRLQHRLPLSARFSRFSLSPLTVIGTRLLVRIICQADAAGSGMCAVTQYKDAPTGPSVCRCPRACPAHDGSWEGGPIVPRGFDTERPSFPLDCRVLLEDASGADGREVEAPTSHPDIG